MVQPTGFETNYTDPNTGINLPESWIELTNILYVPYNYVLVVFDIYESEDSKNAGKQPVITNARGQVQAGSNDWNTYFDPDSMDTAEHNLQKEAVSYLIANISNLRRTKNENN